MTHPIRTNSGMSIIQVLVAIAITVMTGIFTLQMVLQMKKVEVLMSQQSQVNDIEREIQRVLMDPLACYNTLYQLHAPPMYNAHDADIPTLTSDLGFIYGPFKEAAPSNKPIEIFHKGQKFANEQLQLTMINLVKEKPGVTPDVFLAGSVITLYLQLQFQKKFNKSGEKIGGDFIMRWIPLSVHTNNTNGITQCSGVSQQDLTEQICTGMGLTMDATTHKCTILDAVPVVQTVCNALGLGYNSGANKCN